MDRCNPTPPETLEDDPDEGAIDAALFEGHVDAIEAGRVYGWALDPTTPSVRLSVTVFHGDEALGTVVADRFREDLRGYGDGSGRHAFVFTLPKGLWDADPAGFHVVHAGSTVPLVRRDRDGRLVTREGHGGAGEAGSGEIGSPGWLGPVSARLAHLETALVSTARAAALTQINLRELGRDERLAALEETQLRIDRALKAQAEALAGLREELQAARRGGRAHLALTLLLAAGGGALAALLLHPGLLS